MSDSPLPLITSMRDSDGYIESIYTMGGCYQFYLILKSIFIDAEPFINKELDHVITKVNGLFYDITGEVCCDGFRPLINSDLELVSRWSFKRTMSLSIGECRECEEPILV